MLPPSSDSNIYTRDSQKMVMKAVLTSLRLFFSFTQLYDDHSRHSIFQQLLNSSRTPMAWFKHLPPDPHHCWGPLKHLVPSLHVTENLLNQDNISGHFVS